MAAVLAALTGAAAAAEPEAVTIGVLNDQSGVFADDAGAGSVVAAKMAVEDFGGAVLGRPIAVKSADHQNKPDIAAAIAREWFDAEGVAAIFDLANSAAALAVQQLAAERDRVTVVTTAGSTALIGKDCSPTGAVWVWNTYAVALSEAKQLAAGGKRSWFFITADYALGKSMEENMRRAIAAVGGQVVGSVRHPLGTADFSSFLLQAQASRAQVIVLANGGNDTINAAKQAVEFGIYQGGQTVVSPLVFLNTIHAIGLPNAQRLTFVGPYYWDLDSNTRAWAQRFAARMHRMPGDSQAGVYSAVLHYLKAVAAAKTTEGKAVMAEMRALPIADAFTAHGHLRPDGAMAHDMYLFQAKTPAESRGEWDLYKLIRRIPAAEAFPPLDESDCPLVAH